MATRIPDLENRLEKSRDSQDRLKAVNLSLEKKLSALSTRFDAERRQASVIMRRTLLDGDTMGTGPPGGDVWTQWTGCWLPIRMR